METMPLLTDMQSAIMEKYDIYNVNNSFSDARILEMHDDIFHSEIFEHFVKFLKYSEMPFFEVFHETFNFHYEITKLI